MLESIYGVSRKTDTGVCYFLTLQTGIVRVRWDSASPVVCLGGLDGRVQLWDSRSGQRLSTYEGHSSEILDLDLSRYVLFTSFGYSFLPLFVSLFIHVFVVRNVAL